MARQQADAGAVVGGTRAHHTGFANLVAADDAREVRSGRRGRSTDGDNVKRTEQTIRAPKRIVRDGVIHLCA